MIYKVCTSIGTETLSISFTRTSKPVPNLALAETFYPDKPPRVVPTPELPVWFVYKNDKQSLGYL